MFYCNYTGTEFFLFAAPSQYLPRTGMSTQRSRKCTYYTRGRVCVCIYLCIYLFCIFAALFEPHKTRRYYTSLTVLCVTTRIRTGCCGRSRELLPACVRGGGERPSVKFFLWSIGLYRQIKITRHVVSQQNNYMLFFNEIEFFFLLEGDR